VLYQVEQRGRQTAFVGEDGAGLVGLYPLLARAAAIAENENSSFAEALSLAAAERGTPLRRGFADEAGRRILIGWMGIPDADYDNDATVAYDWIHALTMPRELEWKWFY